MPPCTAVAARHGSLARSRSSQRPSKPSYWHNPTARFVAVPCPPDRRDRWSHLAAVSLIANRSRKPLGKNSHRSAGYSHSHWGGFPFPPIPIPNYVYYSHSHGIPMGFPFPLRIQFPCTSLVRRRSFASVSVATRTLDWQVKTKVTFTEMRMIGTAGSSSSAWWSRCLDTTLGSLQHQP